MKGERLFTDRYVPGLVRNGVRNVVLRVYKHIRGFATDDPDNSTEIIYTPCAEVGQRIKDIQALFGEERGIAITSLVSVGTEQKYLLLLDCALPASDENDKWLCERWNSFTDVIKLVALRDGMLLRTRNSYHMIGFCPLTRDMWIRQMARALLLRDDDRRPIVDVRYIGRSLERGYGSLRMSDYQGKPIPDFVLNFL